MRTLWTRVRLGLHPLVTLLISCSSGTEPRRDVSCPLVPPNQVSDRLTRLTSTIASGDERSEHEYFYDEAGRLSRVEYHQNHVRLGPLLHVGRMILFHSELLDSIYYFDRTHELLDFELSSVVTFSRDARGRVTTVGRRTQRELSPLTFRYDESGLLVEMLDGGDNTVFRYSPDCSLIGAEKRFSDGLIIRHDYSLDGQRNPFFARWDLFWGTSFIVETWPTLLSGHNLLRQANSVESVVSMVVNEYSYHANRMPHTQLLTLSNVGAPSEQTRVLYQYTFERASAAFSTTTASRP